jgi:hypothetical protein
LEKKGVDGAGKFTKRIRAELKFLAGVGWGWFCVYSNKMMFIFLYNLSHFKSILSWVG